MVERFLPLIDAHRAQSVLSKLSRHATGDWVLTGGFATEIHHLLLGKPSLRRSLTDVDFVANSFKEIPDSLARDFRFNHVHPFDPPGKTLLQAIDPQHAVRIDVFRAFGTTIERATKIDLGFVEFRVIALEDLTARGARLVFDLVGGSPVPRKYVRDFERLSALLSPARVELAWRDQRKAGQPETFAEASLLIRMARASCSPDLLTELRYSTDVGAICHRCYPASSLTLADPRWVQSILGYC